MTDPDFERLVREHAGVVARVAVAYAAKGPDRDDLAQELLLGLWRAWPRFRGESSPRTFVYRVTQNVAFDHLRRRYRNREDLVDAEAASQVPDTGGRLDLEAAVRSLRLPLREVVVLALEGLGAAWKEQAEELDMESMLVRLGERRTMERVERVVFWCAALVYAVFGAQAALKADVPTAGALLIGLVGIGWGVFAQRQLDRTVATTTASPLSELVARERDNATRFARGRWLSCVLCGYPVAWLLWNLTVDAAATRANPVSALLPPVVMAAVAAASVWGSISKTREAQARLAATERFLAEREAA